MNNESLGRNIVNAKQIIPTVKARLTALSTHPTVQKWMLSKYRKWLINDYQNITAVLTEAQYHQLMNKKPPEWFVASIAGSSAHAKPFYIDLTNNELVTIEQKLIEALSSRLNSIEEPKFHKYSVEQILEKWEQDHAMMIENGKPLFPTSQQALENIFSIEGHTFYQFIPHEELRKELHNESVMMGHCIGQFENFDSLTEGYGEQYLQMIESHSRQIYTLRDTKNQAHATFELLPNGAIQQIKGKQNTTPVKKYVTAIIAFLNHLNIHEQYTNELAEMGISYEYGCFKSIEQIFDKDKLFYLVYQKPSLIKLIDAKRYHPMYTWAVLLSDRKHISWIPKQCIQPEHKNFATTNKPIIQDITDPEVAEPNAFNWMKQLSLNFSIRLGGDNILFGLYPDDKGLLFNKEILLNSWDITDKKSALNTLLSLYHSGHLSSFMPSSEKPLMTARAVLAFDIARLIQVARSCYYCGFITQQEALSYCINHCYIAQTCFDNLADYFHCYLYGREIWGAIDNKVREEVEKIALDTDPYATKLKLPWDLPLDFHSKPSLLKRLKISQYHPKKNAKYYEQLGNYYSRQDDFETAYQHYKTSFALSNDIDIQHEMAYSLYSLNQIEEALSIVNEVLAKQANHISALRTKAQILCHELKDYSQAITLQYKAAYIAQDYFEFRMLAKIYYLAEEYTQAIYYYRLSTSLDIEQENDTADIKYKLTYSLYFTAQYDEAEIAVKDYLATEKYDGEIDMLIGVCWAKKGKLLDAYNHYLTIIERDDLTDSAIRLLKLNIEGMANRKDLAHLNLPRTV